MTSHNLVAKNMDYIQKVFLGVQTYMQQHHELNDLVKFLDSEPPAYRSVAYEAASFEIAVQDLTMRGDLTNWKEFYLGSAQTHTFHVDIGLGWAFAKTEIAPTPFLDSSQPAKSIMVFDGLGYYYGLFKGRRTVRNQSFPEVVGGNDLPGFDQGVGRRLWYISKGDVSVLTQLLQPFEVLRQGDLWRGVGIACGYVGGSDEAILKQLSESSASFKNQLCTGIELAVMSRTVSKSVTPDLHLAADIICRKTLKEVMNLQPDLHRLFL